MIDDPGPRRATTVRCGCGDVILGYVEGEACPGCGEVVLGD